MDERANLLFYGIFRYFILSDSHHLLQRKALRINLRAFSLNNATKALMVAWKSAFCRNSDIIDIKVLQENLYYRPET